MITKLFKKKEIILLIIFFSIISSFLINIFIFGWSSTWQFVKIPAMDPIFADMRIIQGALKTESMGLNPYIENPGDYWNRQINYQTLWMDIAKILNLQNENYFMIYNILLIFIFLTICLSLLLKTKSYIFLLIIFSSSTLLAIERGNSDLLIFSIVYLSSFLLPIYSFIFISIAAFLKIYPLALMPTLFDNKKALLYFSIIGVAIFYYHYEDLVYLINNTPKSAGLSYGSSTISKAFSKFSINIHDSYISLALIISIIFFYSIFKNKIKLEAKEIDQKVLIRFLYGGLIYVGTFLLGKNFDYRLIFLILCYEFIFLIKTTKLRIFLIVNMIFSFSYLPLVFIFGEFLGALLCLIPKIILLHFISYFIMIILETRSVFIKNILNHLRIQM